MCRLLSGCVVAFVSTYAHGQSNGPSDTPHDYAQRVQIIVSSLKEPNYDDELLEHPLMKEVFENPGRFLSEAEAYLVQHSDLTKVQARVALSALQCAPLDDYLRLLDTLGRAGRGKVNQWSLFYAVTPGFEWSTRLAKRFRDKTVRDTLNRLVRSANATAAVRSSVVHILDGTAARSIEREKWVPMLRCKNTE
jgi:hypothetical protein